MTSENKRWKDKEWNEEEESALFFRDFTCAKCGEVESTWEEKSEIGFSECPECGADLCFSCAKKTCVCGASLTE